jgi:hypothetical protein
MLSAVQEGSFDEKSPKTPGGIMIPKGIRAAQFGYRRTVIAELPEHAVAFVSKRHELPNLSLNFSRILFTTGSDSSERRCHGLVVDA